MLYQVSDAVYCSSAASTAYEFPLIDAIVEPNGANGPEIEVRLLRRCIPSVCSTGLNNSIVGNLWCCMCWTAHAVSCTVPCAGTRRVSAAEQSRRCHKPALLCPVVAMASASAGHQACTRAASFLWSSCPDAAAAALADAALADAIGASGRHPLLPQDG